MPSPLAMMMKWTKKTRLPETNPTKVVIPNKEMLSTKMMIHRRLLIIDRSDE
jgi:hypothetical protein